MDDAPGQGRHPQGGVAPYPPPESLESIAAVIDALADERSLPRTEIIRTMIADLEGRIAVDRAVIVLLRRLERG